jgi:hypothetical protein
MRTRGRRTDYHLWALAAGLSFIALVAADLSGRPADDAAAVPTTTRQVLKAVARRGVVFVTLSAAVGWLVQAAAVAGGLRVAGEPAGPEVADYHEVAGTEPAPDVPWDERLDRLVVLKRQGVLLARGRPSPGQHQERDRLTR